MLTLSGAGQGQNGSSVDDRFIITVKTDNAGTSAANQFTIPTSFGTYLYDIETSDGQTLTGNTGNTTITFPSAGTYDIFISGSFPYMRFNNGGDRLKLLDIKNFGIYALGSTVQQQAFSGCSNMDISATDIGHFENVTNFIQTFRDCSSLTTLPLIDTRAAVTFSTFLENCVNLTSFPLLDFSSADDIQRAWWNCRSLTSFPLIDTSSVTQMQGAWMQCVNLTSFPPINTSNVTVFSTGYYAAWKSCTSLTSFPLIDTSNTNDLREVWRSCTSLTSFPANAFDTNIATNYTSAFTSTNLTTQSIDDILVSLDTSGVSNGTFSQSGGQGRSYNSNAAVSNLIAKGWTLTLTTPVASDEFVFTVKTDNAGTSTDTQFTIPTSTSGITEAFLYDIETSDGQSITGVTGNHTITFPSAGEYEVKISGSFPYMYFANGGDKLKLLDIKNFGVYALGSTSQFKAFQGCSNMVITATDNGNFGSVSNFDSSWRDCSSLTSFPLLDTSSGTNFYAAWFGCSSLTSFPLLNTSSGTNFAYAWNNCSSLTSFPLLDTSSGTRFDYAWKGCSSLTSFPSNAFDTNIATNYGEAFLTTNLTTQSIDDILVSLDTSGISNGTFTQSGGQAPSATGETAIDSLVGKGWTITVTGGYTPPTFSLDFDTIADDFTFTRNSFATRVNESGLIETVSSDIPRIDYSTGEAAFLLEPQSTNLLPYSEDFSNSYWNKGGDTAIVGGYLAPDGTNSAYKVSGTTSVLQVPGVTNTTDTRSIYARTVSGSGELNLCSFNGNTNNLFTITEDWQRFEVNEAITTGAETFYAVDFRGTSSLNEVILWGAQLEQLPYATSYIPTNGSIVTRAAESCVKYNLSTDGIFGGKVGTLFLHTTDMAVVGTSLNPLIPFRLYRQSGDAYRFYYDTDASFIGSSIDLSNNGGELKMAFSISETGVEIYVNGSLHVSYTYVNPMPSDLENWVWSTETKYKERVKDFKVYDKVLTDEELIELTTI